MAEFFILNAEPTVGLYVHIPFCSVKCFYCDFAAFSGQKKTTSRYLAALEAEARLMPARLPTTLYIGGGTPSELEADEITELFALLRRAYPEARFREITFEANPESLDAGKLEVLAACGVTRLSLGLQTADAALLKSIGRRHSPEEFFRVYGLAKATKAFALSVDLMYGLPGQTLEACLSSLDQVLAQEPEHLSLYGLQVEDRTLFAKRCVEPDEDLGREMFEACLDRIARAGLIHYEISNFARPGHASRHNLAYWDDNEYVGLGCGAASHLDGIRSTNTDKLADYCRLVEAGQRPISESERVLGREKSGEQAFLGLRKIAGFIPSPKLETEFEADWRALIAQGLVVRDGARLRLSRHGVFLANEAFSRFVPPFQTTAEVK